MKFMTKEDEVGRKKEMRRTEDRGDRSCGDGRGGFGGVGWAGGGRPPGEGVPTYFLATKNPLIIVDTIEMIRTACLAKLLVELSTILSMCAGGQQFVFLRRLTTNNFLNSERGFNKNTMSNLESR